MAEVTFDIKIDTEEIVSKVMSNILSTMVSDIRSDLNLEEIRRRLVEILSSEEWWRSHWREQDEKFASQEAAQSA